MDLTELTAHTKRLQDEVSKAMQEHGKVAITDELRGLLCMHPGLQLKWQQYTPHFSDGDPCVFQLGGVCLSMPSEAADNNGENEWDAWTMKHYLGQPESPSWATPALSEKFTAVTGLLESNNELLQTLFGDGVEVTVDMDGITIDSCDHD